MESKIYVGLQNIGFGESQCSREMVLFVKNVAVIQQKIIQFTHIILNYSQRIKIGCLVLITALLFARNATTTSIRNLAGANSMGAERDLANAIYGEAANQDYKTMKMVGSSAIQRLKSGRAKEFGSDMQSVLRNGYYAVSNPNTPYKQALAQKFPDKESENRYKQALQIASGLLKGTIEPDKVQFYFTKQEEARMRKQGKKVFNFDIVKPSGQVGIYNTYTY
jgi:hypothetical protein